MEGMNAMAAPESGAKLRTPVTILTGFLGAGKTTLVNYILRACHGHRIAVIENEFGEVAVDDALVLQTEEEIFEMNNGCICCTVRGDLIRILNRLRRKREKFDHIIIETTGLADPAPVAQTFFLDDDVKADFELDAIITVVDAKHIIAHLDEQKPEGVENEAVEQVAFADRIILNKVDLVNDDEKSLVKARLHAINTYADVVETQQSVVDLQLLLNIKRFDLARVIDMDNEFLNGIGEHQHDERVSSVGIQVEGAVDMVKLNAWLSRLLATKGVDIFRAKGVLNISGSEARHVFQGVHMLMGFSSSEDGSIAPWKQDEVRTNRLVFIGRNLDREQFNGQFRACIA
jgi:G3E family GTPase